MTSYRDWVVELSNITGAGAYNLAGAPAGTSYFTFRQRYANGEDEVVYWVVNADRTKWEKNQLGTLTYGTPDVLSRNVVESTNGDAPVSWVGGDLPLRVYVVPDSAAQQGMISGWLATARHALLRFGHWFDQDNPSSGKHTWNIFDGTNDIPVGVVDTAAHTLLLDPTLSGWRQIGVASPAAASFVDFTNIPATINHLMLLFEVRPGTDGAILIIRTYGADGVLDVGGSDYFGIGILNDGTTVTGGAATSSLVNITGAVDNGTFGCNGHIIFENIQAATPTKFSWHTFWLDSGGTSARMDVGSGDRQEADRITGLRLAASTGTMTGKVTLFGSV